MLWNTCHANHTGHWRAFSPCAGAGCYRSPPTNHVPTSAPQSPCTWLQPGTTRTSELGLGETKPREMLRGPMSAGLCSQPGPSGKNAALQALNPPDTYTALQQWHGTPATQHCPSRVTQRWLGGNLVVLPASSRDQQQGWKAFTCLWWVSSMCCWDVVSAASDSYTAVHSGWRHRKPVITSKKGEKSWVILSW